MSSQERASVPPARWTLHGRTNELGALERWLESDGPILTVTGPIGVGKTRLAREVFERLQGRGVHARWLDLSRIFDPHDLDAAPVVVLDQADSALTSLRARLGRGPTRFLVTSREATLISGEQCLALAPLEPADGEQLFVERVRALRALDAPEEATARAIVGSVGGNPALLEIAAGYAVSMSLEEVRRRCVERVEGGLLDLGVDAWSDPGELRLVRSLDEAWAALPPAHARALASLALFRGPFPLEAAAAVGADARALRELVRRSLVRRKALGAISLYEVEAPMDGYAARRSAERGDAGAIRRAWCEWSIGRAEEELAEHRPPLAGVANLLAVITDRMRADDVDSAVRAMRAVGALARSQGSSELSVARGSELLDWLGASSVHRHAVLHARGRLLRMSGELARAREDLAGAVNGNGPTAAEAHLDLANLCRHQHEFDRAAQHFELASALGPALRCRVLIAQASMEHERGDLARASELFQRSIEAARRAGDARSEALAVQNHGLLLQESGRLEDAEQAFVRTLALHLAARDRRFEGIGHSDLAGVALERGQRDVAREHYSAARSIAVEIGDRREEGLDTALLAVLAAMEGDERSARNSFDAARRILEPLGQPALVAALSVHETHLDLQRAAARVVDGQPCVLPPLPRVDVAGDEVRFALRIALRERQRIAELDGSLLVAEDGTWFRPPGGPRVRFDQHGVLPALVRALAERPVDVEQLIRAGWPESRALTAASKNRLNVALSKLRKLGLEPHLRREGSTYHLERRVRVPGAMPD